ncbi:MAG: hypothetical protein JKY30_12075 [Flavobacteriales bacterium]|nr:hypothetical protein [Flavobacteriales bacterium]
MKNLILTLLTSFTLFSCVEVKFKEPQPIKTKKITEFPIDLRGKYLVTSKDSLKDTILITKNYYTELTPNTMTNTNKKDKFFISDSLVLKKIDNQYILNIKEKDMWMVAVLRKINNDDWSIFILDSEDEAIEKVKKITEIETIKNKKGEVSAYILNPNKSEFKKLLYTKDIFIKLNQLKKLQE